MLKKPLYASLISITALTVLLGTTSIVSAQRPGARDRDRRPDGLKEGDPAPEFTLKSPDGKQTVKLSDFRDNKPVALVFGSYT